MNTSHRRTIGAFAILAPALALAAPSTARAQQQEEAAERTVTVAALGRVTREPDRAVLNLAVESFAATAREAAAANASKMEALVAALRRLGLSEDQVETESYFLNPEHDRRGEPGEPRIVGYRAVNTVRVTVDDIARVGEVIDAAIAAGADRVNGLSFQLRDPEEARRDALRDAISKARTEAETVAGAVDRSLGPVLSVMTGGFERPVVMARGMAADALAAPTPIEPGTLDVVASVTVVFRLEPR